MANVIKGIDADDPACVRLGIEFIEEDGKFLVWKDPQVEHGARLRSMSLSDQQARGHPPTRVQHAARRASSRTSSVNMRSSRERSVSTPANWPSCQVCESACYARFRSYLQACAARPGINQNLRWTGTSSSVNSKLTVGWHSAGH